MTPEQREMARQRYERFRQLPPEQQERLRRRAQWFKNLPPERRAELREKWQNMTPEQRQEYKEKWRRDDSGPAYERGMSPRQERPGRMGPR
jgi:hypothetical protein